MIFVPITRKWHRRTVFLSTARYLNTHTYKESLGERVCNVPFPASYLSTGSVYIHWPYCRQRCSYCNFVKFIPHSNSRWTVSDDVLEDAMVEELQNHLKHSHISTVSSVFFGGGTPSLARPQMVEKVLKTIRQVCHLQENAEITLEGNPTSLETNKLNNFKTVGGINRVSIGVQALDEKSLRILNRDHNVTDALQCIEVAKQLFPGRVSMDLIFGRPYQTKESWLKELKKALTFCDNHMSLYQLTVERGTKLFRQVKTGELTVPDAEQMADLYETAVSLLETSGFKRYEVSNFAKGDMSESVHNKSYWQGMQYIGIGPGAHSRVVPKHVTCDNNVINYSYPDKVLDNTSNFKMSKAKQNEVVSEKHNTIYLNKNIIREARVNAADPVSWLTEVKRKGTGVRKITPQTRLDVLCECVSTGLRTSEGVTSVKWHMFLPELSLWDIFHDSTIWLQQSNMLEVTGNGLKVTQSGLNVLDSILPFLLCILERKVT